MFVMRKTRPCIEYDCHPDVSAKLPKVMVYLAMSDLVQLHVIGFSFEHPEYKYLFPIGEIAHQIVSPWKPYGYFRFRRPDAEGFQRLDARHKAGGTLWLNEKPAQDFISVLASIKDGSMPGDACLDFLLAHRQVSSVLKASIDRLIKFYLTTEKIPLV